MIGESSLRARLADDWALPDATVEAHHGGMGSATWLVSQAGRRWVAKAVAPALRAQFSGGLSVATMLDAAGIPAGAPVPTLDGRSVVDLGAASLALLTWVEGDPLTGAGADEQRMIGDSRAVHQALHGTSVAGRSGPPPQAAAGDPALRPAVIDLPYTAVNTRRSCHCGQPVTAPVASTGLAVERPDRPGDALSL